MSQESICLINLSEPSIANSMEEKPSDMQPSLSESFMAQSDEKPLDMPQLLNESSEIPSAEEIPDMLPLLNESTETPIAIEEVGAIKPRENSQSYLRKLGQVQAMYKNMIRTAITDAIIKNTAVGPHPKKYINIEIPFTYQVKDDNNQPMLNAKGFPIYKPGYIMLDNQKYLLEDLHYGRKNDRVPDNITDTIDTYKNRIRHNFEFDSFAKLQVDFHKAYGWYLLDESNRPNWNETKNRGKSNVFFIRLYFQKPDHYDTREELWHGKNRIPFLHKKKEEKPQVDINAIIRQELKSVMVPQRKLERLNRRRKNMVDIPRLTE